MTGIRIVAIIVGIAVTFSVAHWLDIYIAGALGILAYFATRYIGWAIYEQSAPPSRERPISEESNARSWRSKFKLRQCQC